MKLQLIDNDATNHSEELSLLIHRFFCKKLLIGAEIGVNIGTTAQYILEHNYISKLYLIDPWLSYIEYDDDLNKYGQEEFERRYKTVVESLSRYSQAVIIRKKSIEVDIIDLDFVFIDANHAKKYVLEDIHHWHPKIKPGGVLFGHDFGLQSTQDALSEFNPNLVFYAKHSCWAIQKEN